QAEVATRVSQGARRIVPGGITTVTSEAVFSEVAPKVAVPLMDQLAWRDPVEFARIAAAVLDPELPSRSKELGRAEAMFVELKPPIDLPEDGPYVAVAGPRALLDAIKGMSNCYDGGESSTEFVAKVEALVDKNSANVDLAKGNASASSYSEW